MPEKQRDSESDGSSNCSCPKTAKKELLQVENQCPTNEIENHEGDKLSEDKELCDLAKQFEKALKRVKELKLCHLVEPIETTLCKLKQLDEITEKLACKFFDANSCSDKDCCDDREALSPPKSAEQPFFDAVCISLTPTTQTTCCSKKTRRKRKNNYDNNNSRPAFNDNNEENDDESHEISCACSSCHCGSKASFSSSCPDLPPYHDADDEDDPPTKIPAKNCDKKNKKKEDKCNLPCGCKTSNDVTGKISRNLGCRLASRLRNVDVTSGFQIQADVRGKSVSVNRTRSLRTDTTYYQAQPVDEAVSCNLPVSSGSSDASRSTSSVAEYESERSSLNGGDDAIVADCRMQKDRFRRPPRGSPNEACESAKGDQSYKQNRDGGGVGGGCGCGHRSSNCEKNEAQLTCPCGCGDLMSLPQQNCDRRCENCGKEILDALEAEFYAEIRSQGLLDDSPTQDTPRGSCQQRTFPGEDRLPPIFHTDIKSYIESLEDKCKEKDKIITELKRMIEEK